MSRTEVYVHRRSQRITDQCEIPISKTIEKKYGPRSSYTSRRKFYIVVNSSVPEWEGMTLQQIWDSIET